MQLGAAGEQFLHRRRIGLIVSRHHPAVGGLAGLHDDALVRLRQRVPLLQIDKAHDHRAAFPPSGIVIVRRDLVEAELFVVIRTDPFGGIDRAFFKRRIDVAAGKLLWHHAQLLHDFSGEAADAHLQSLEIVDGVDLLAEPAAHLAAGIAREEGDAVVALVEIVHQIPAAALHVPGLVEALVRAERHRGGEGKGRVLAEVVIGRGVSHLDGAVLYGVENLQTRHDFAAGKRLNLELVVGGFGDIFGEQLSTAPQRVERFRPARRHTPLELRHRLRDRRRGHRGCARNANTGNFEKISSLHGIPTLCCCVTRVWARSILKTASGLGGSCAGLLAEAWRHHGTTGSRFPSLSD